MSVSTVSFTYYEFCYNAQNDKQYIHEADELTRIKYLYFIILLPPKSSTTKQGKQMTKKILKHD